jgi:4,5-dihydroxyphthalate decarboxylase
MAVELSIACGDTDLNRALLSGAVEPEGVDAHAMAVHPSTRHRRFVRFGDFDVSELSLATLLAASERPEEFPFTAVPAFPSKKFRHSYFYTRADADVEDPADLASRSVGISSWQTTANVWMRGIAREHYGLDLESVTWYRRKADDIARSVPDRYDVRKLPRAESKSVAKRDNLLRALRSGTVDAVMDPSGQIFSAVAEDEALDFVFEDPLAEERSYYEETGIYPPMHTVAIRDAVLETHPWVAVNVYDAFRESRDRALEERDLGPESMTWSHLHRLAQERVFDGTAWEYGLTEANRRALEKLIEYADRQGVIESTVPVADLFVPSTRAEVGT